MLQNLIMDACLGKFIVRYMMQGVKETSITQLIKDCQVIADLLRNEYLLRDPRGFPETVHHRIKCIE